MEGTTSNNTKLLAVKNEYECEICETVFKNKNGLKKHFITIHGNTSIGNVGKAFNCNICPKSYSRADHLKNHIHTVHDGHKDHKCKSCAISK